MQCFCGCGLKVPWRLRATNKRAARLRKDGDRIQMLLDRGMESPHATMFVEQATEWCDVFAGSIHAGLDPEQEQPGFFRVYSNWRSHVRPFIGQYGVAYFGARIRDLGLPRDDALAVISSGQFDPYLGLSMPLPSERAIELPDAQ